MALYPHGYQRTNLGASLAAAAFTPGSGPSDASRSFLVDRRMDKVYEFTAVSGDNELVIDFGSAVSLGAIALLNSNVVDAPGGEPTVTVEAADNSGISVNAVLAKDETLLNITLPYHRDHVLQFPAVSRRFWRITWFWSGSFQLTLGEIFFAAGVTSLPRRSTYGSGDALRVLDVSVEMQYGDSRVTLLGGPQRVKRLRFADLSATDAQALRTMWLTMGGRALPFLWVEQVQAATQGAPAAEQECVFGRLQAPDFAEPQEDFGVYQTAELEVRSMGRQVGL